MPSTQCILSHWKRPENIAKILDALRKQTVPFDKIIIVDNSPDESYRLSVQSSDVDIWRFPDNGYGPTCRFAPALINFRYDYTLFIDDDLIPGQTLHQECRVMAHNLRDRFATLGVVGRIYQYMADNPVMLRYGYEVKDVNRSTSITQVDLTCRLHFARTENIWATLKHRRDLCVGFYPPEGDLDWSRHDDILLCHALQSYEDAPSYLLPKSATFENLPEPDAMWQRPRHVQTRTRLINASGISGWQSLINRGN